MINVPGQDKPVCYCKKPCAESAYTTRVFEYGCLPERLRVGYSGIDIAIDQMKSMKLLWNEFALMDRHSRVEYRHLTTDPTIEAAIEPLEARLEAIQAIIQKQKKTENAKKITIDPAVAKDLKDVKENLKKLQEQLKLARANMKLVNKADLDKLKADIDAGIENACEQSPLLHSNRNWTRKLYERASSAAMKKADGSMLNSKRFDGTGSVTVKFTNGLSLAEAYQWIDTKGFFQIGTLIGKKTTLCRLRVHSDAKQKPIWLQVPVVFHRPLPPGADIREVTFKRNMVAGKPVWKVCISVRLPHKLQTKLDGRVAFNFGWRQLYQKASSGDQVPAGVRVAYWYDGTDHGEYILPQNHIDQWRKIDGLQSTMKNKLNEVLGKLAPWFKSAAGVPQVVANECCASVLLEKDVWTTAGQFSMHLWKSEPRLVRFMNVWKANRFPGDGQMWDEIDFWFRGAKVLPSPIWNGHQHLQNYADNLRDQLGRERRELYRLFAAGGSMKIGANETLTFPGLVKRSYGIVHIEKDFDLSAIARTPAPENDTAYDKLARYNRKVAAVSVLRGAIENVCGRERLTISPVQCTNITKTCHACGSLETFDAALDVFHKCAKCSIQWDQDFNAAVNLYNRALGIGPHPVAKVQRTVIPTSGGTLSNTAGSLAPI